MALRVDQTPSPPRAPVKLVAVTVVTPDMSIAVLPEAPKPSCVSAIRNGPVNSVAVIATEDALIASLILSPTDGALPKAPSTPMITLSPSLVPSTVETLCLNIKPTASPAASVRVNVSSLSGPPVVVIAAVACVFGAINTLPD